MAAKMSDKSPQAWHLFQYLRHGYFHFADRNLWYFRISGMSILKHIQLDKKALLMTKFLVFSSAHP